MGKEDKQTPKRSDRISDTPTSITKAKNKVPLEVRRGVDCSLCGRNGSDNGEYFGELYFFEHREKRYAAHEICLMLAANLVVPNDHVDSSVLMGFRPEDIVKEVRRGSSLACSVCRFRGATLGCTICPLTFHMPCARQAGAFFDFSECSTYCKAHWPTPDLKRLMSNKKQSRTEMTLKGCLATVSSVNFPIATETECSLVCTEPIEPRPQLLKVIMTNCCQPLFTHFDCMERYAATMGSDTKCARCNVSNDAFHKNLNKQGIYISVRGATLDDLVDHTWRCIAADCKCPMGRAYFDKPNPRIFQSWEWINDCPTCESEIHRACAGPPWSLFDPNEDAEGEEAVWVCQGCSDNAAHLADPDRGGDLPPSSASSEPMNDPLVASDSENKPNEPQQQVSKCVRSSRRSVATNTPSKRRSTQTAAPISNKNRNASTKIGDLYKNSSEEVAQPTSSKKAITTEILNRLNDLNAYHKRHAEQYDSSGFKRRKPNPSAKNPGERVSGPLDRFVVKVPFGSDALATSSPRIRH